MRIYPGRLSRLYKEHKIRKKKIRLTKILTLKQKRKQAQQAKQSFNELVDLLEQGFDIIYVDEVMFTTKTLPQTVWSLKNQPILIDYKQF